MTELSLDGPTLAIAEEVDLTLDVKATDVAGEDFDLDLGGGADLERDDGEGPTSNLTKIEIGADLDEINYEEETHHDAAEEIATAEADNIRADQENNAPTNDDAADEIDYEDTEIHATTTTQDSHNGDHHAAQSHDGDVSESQEHHETGGKHREHNDIDFGFDDADDSHGGEGEHGEHGEHEEHEEHGEHEGHGEHDRNDHGEYEQEGDDSHEYDEDDEDGEMAESKQEDEEDEEEEDEDENDDNRGQRAEVDHDESDGTGQDYNRDENDEEDSDSDSGLGALRNFYPVSTFDVMVTWGDQVCPLFKTPGVEDPDMFYLEDYEALNYPLSRFLQTIRSSISSWVRASDEILIRVNELGLEFGETTTEALLSQVTFHNLLALHNTLVKNDDSESTKGVHITLSTRPNCLLRLKDLVGGAGSGKGLSAFPSASTRVDESSDDSGEAEADSDDSSPDGEVDEIVEEDDDEEIEDDIEEDAADDIDMAGSFDDAESVASQSFAEAADKEAAQPELDTPTADEDADAAEEIDYINYTNEEVDDSVDGAHLGPEGVTDLPTPHADVGDEFEFANAEDNLIDGLAADEAKLDQGDDLDLLEDINDDGDIVSHDRDVATVDAAGHEDRREHQDDFLDLGGDIDAATSAATLETSNKADDLEPSLDTSATATLDNDEIDYEDSRPAGEETHAVVDSGADEIDWDVEIKNTAPADATDASPAASGKRTRDVDESGDALLGDLPDVKRVRTGNTP